MRIDSHQHFWRYSPHEYPWIQPEWPIRRDFLPDDLAPELRACELGGCIAVQARQSIEETRWLLALAKEAPIIKGVVGWVDLRSPEVEDQLAELTADRTLVGVRHVVQDEPDSFMLGKEFQRGISKLQAYDLAYDLLIFAQQLPAAIELVRSFPDQRFVLDHLAKPAIRGAIVSPWREQLNELAAFPNVMCKVSGFVTEAQWQGWQPSDFVPYLDSALKAFGVDRLMFGSDWPVALLAATYQDVFALVKDYVDRRVPDEAAKVFGLNAASFYKL